MRLISWNVNGIRAWQKKGYLGWFLKESPDFFCIQETKAEKTQLESTLSDPEGYYSYFDHSKGRKGYSGVAIYSKKKALKVEYGLGVEALDQEGRFISLHFKDFLLINTYFPNGGGGPERLAYKLQYYDAFLLYIKKLKRAGKKIVFCGDVNTAHAEIDLARPKENMTNTGFLPIERAWVDSVIKEGFIDSYRKLHSDVTGAYTYWDMKTFARDRNVGWRIDYFFISSDLEECLVKSEILNEVFGSDHCPYELVLDFDL